MKDILPTMRKPRKSYIYKVTNFVTGQYYIGSQCRGKIIGVNYFTSSTNKAFREGFKTYGEEKYKIEIIKEFEDPKKCVNAENYIIRNYMLKKDGLCLNRFYCCGGEKIFSRVGLHHTEETKQKLSLTRKGIHPSEETKQKISTAKKGTHLSEETRKKMSISKKGHPAWNKGIHHSDEARKKMSISKKGRPAWNKGIHHSDEARKKISTAKKIKISIEGEVFNSLTEASKYYNVAVSTIGYWIKKNQHNAFYIKK